MDDAEFRRVLLKGVLGVLSESLKPLGFKKNGRRFERTRGEMFDLVSVQTDRTPMPGELGFRINPETVPVLLWQKWVALWSSSPKIGPGYMFCEAQLSKFTSDGKDRWHRAYSLAEAVGFAQSDTHILVEAALPHLEQFPDTQSFIDGLKANWRYTCTSAYATNLIAAWEGRPLIDMRHFVVDNKEQRERIINDPKVNALVMEVAERKQAFYSRRKRK